MMKERSNISNIKVSKRKQKKNNICWSIERKISTLYYLSKTKFALD